MTVIEEAQLIKENENLKELICKVYEKAAGELSWCGPLIMTPDWAIPGLERAVDSLIQELDRARNPARIETQSTYGK